MRILQSGAFVVLLAACGGDPPKPEAKIEEEAWFPEDEAEAELDAVDEAPPAPAGAPEAIAPAALADAAAMARPATAPTETAPAEAAPAEDTTEADEAPQPSEVAPKRPTAPRAKTPRPAAEPPAEAPTPAEAPAPVADVPPAAPEPPAPVAEAPKPVADPPPKPKPTIEQRLSGDYRYAGGATQRSKAEAAVEAVVSEMNALSRGIARRRLLDSSQPAKSMKLRLDGKSVRAVFDGRSYEATVGGSSVRVTGPSGDPLDFKVRMKNEQLMLSFSGGKGGKKYVLRPTRDGRVQMRVTIHSSSLPKSVVYQLTYKRS
jgi:hypothetical protein